MNQKILIVEDQFIEANHLRIMLQRAEYTVCGVARSVEQAEEMIETHRPDLVLLDIFLTGKRTGIDLAAQLKEANIPFIYLSANSNEEVLNAAKATHPYGFLVKPFRDNDLLVTLQIAQYHHENGLESQLRKETQLQTQLATITAGQSNRQQRLLMIAQVLQPFISFDMLVVGSLDEAGAQQHDTLHFLRIGFNEYQVFTHDGLKVILNARPAHAVPANERAFSQVQYFNETSFKSVIAKPGTHKIMAETFGMNALLTLPLPPGAHHRQCFFSFYSRRPDAFTDDHVSLGQRIQPFLVLATQSMSESRVPAIGSDVMHGLPEPSPNSVFDNIIGTSPQLTAVFELISQVAPVDTSVLITGASGTGKERVADSIHALSPRKAHPLIKVNCAALPANLIESELFGHEKGAFTGAIEKRTGRFEQANNGTIFLDEIGDVPLETQVKLLRVLQQREIERIGGKAPVKVNIRIIAATNKNLEKEVAEGRFRLDLYYRLNVFPIQLPSLTERKEDIPLLVNHFIGIYSRKTGRKISGVSDKALAVLMAYDWPGNIRELENITERAVLLAKGNLIEHISLPVRQPAMPSEKAEEVRLKTIFENERDYIIQVLEKCNGRIRGEDGAAAILKIPPTTLGSKMKKLGIKRNFSF
ncbi:DNA-binding transcriptional response regulator, NtrC family, contains REC, AAA-type ATPase, and a Fis-type DNA-binding domains [Dyadobacter soli]|uniref:DNA-binding transcriptional response regulator, NtrC family, contains REC, AAA-type ATPase, and a Fis-type DNA-binding domains n=1 Tax=Dyadobacter soli TaxID=659014 RepID=A0A1G8C5P3_9BACT|nr:sigma 54-interacting response regulator [Dyadobacter soli]SDH40712.1 DNA-binding transcriptional response regulator, NtrC family, contains REC, AAA-type ATPase, and a Fis-type DNA-binding domains [Dyadobacter soli]